MEKPNISLVIGAVIQSKIEKIDLEDALKRESLGRFPTRDLFEAMYNAAIKSDNLNYFLRIIRYWSKCGVEELDCEKKLVLEFYK